MYNVERHQLVWLSAEGWDVVMAGAPEQHLSALHRWRQEDMPAVARRRDADAAADDICLGLPLPPDWNTGAKVRVSLRVPQRYVTCVRDALDISSVLHAAGPWREALSQLGEAAEFRVFGSLAMQALSHMQYVSASSDIDILFRPASRQQLEDGLALLARYAGELPLDGEIVFPGGAAVSWKEWRMAMTHPAKVLVKDLQSVRLADTASLLATLEAP